MMNEVFRINIKAQELVGDTGRKCRLNFAEKAIITSIRRNMRNNLNDKKIPPNHQELCDRSIKIRQIADIGHSVIFTRCSMLRINHEL